MGFLPKTVCMAMFFFHFLGKQNKLLEIMTGFEMRKMMSLFLFACNRILNAAICKWKVLTGQTQLISS